MIAPYIRLLRPHQWVKNVLCFAGLIFSGKLFVPSAILDSWGAFLSFIAVSSSVYVVNDIVDRESDRQHPEKKHRPIASREVSVASASVLGILLAGAGIAGSYFLGTYVLACLVAYVVNNAAYSFYLKHVPLLDVGSIAFGFVLRLLSGIYAVGETPTSWILLCTFFLALFFAFSKRRSELASVASSNPSQRPVLSEYSLDILDDMLSNTAMMSVISYALFTVLSSGDRVLVSTVPIVYYAISKYKLSVIRDGIGENPSSIILRSREIITSVVLWVFIYVLVIY
jgi:4-hydroxybenzoate polyprenyltransferase